MDPEPSQPSDDALRSPDSPDSQPPGEPGGFPFTPSGVSSFAATGWGRLLLWQCVVAVALGGGILLVLGQHWAPVLDRVIEDHFPQKTGLQDGQLIWPDDEPATSPHNAYLCVIIDPANTLEHNEQADVVIELRRTHWMLHSVLGYQAYHYHSGNHQWSREEFIPWWGSRRPFLTLGAGAGTGLAFVLGTALIGLMLVWPVRLLAYFTNGTGNLGPLWRLSTAALLPGGMMLAMGLLCYAMRLLPLMALLPLLAVATLISLVYLVLATLTLPHAEKIAANPFAGEGESDEEDEAPETDTNNPFQDEGADR